MQNRIRDVRKAKGLTLAEVGARCRPATTAQTIGRLETGMRTLSVDWLNRIAGALDVEPSALVTLPDQSDIPVAARLLSQAPIAPSKPIRLIAPIPSPGMIGMVVEAAQGDYRSGDQLWLDQLPPERFADALNRDVLVPRSAGRFSFGRLINVSPKDQMIGLLPSASGAKQITVSGAPWIAVVRTLVRQSS